MKRGTKEFEEVQEAFEDMVNQGALDYLFDRSDKGGFNSTKFYAKDETNKAFCAFVAGYLTAKRNLQ